MFSICIAGHINHGKTAIAKELTGINTDRLPEENARGISIELGYAKYKIDKNQKYLTTNQFLEKIDSNLRKSLY